MRVLSFLMGEKRTATNAEYPLIMNDAAGFRIFHAAYVTAPGTDIIVDLSTCFRLPAPYHHPFVLDPTTGERVKDVEADAVNGS
jgi:hypothetical protein